MRAKLEKDMNWPEILEKHEKEEQDRCKTLQDKIEAGIPLDSEDRAQQRR